MYRTFLWPSKRAGRYILPLWFLSYIFSFFPGLFSAVADWMSTTLPHMMWRSALGLLKIQNAKKFAICRPSHYIIASKACIEDRKKSLLKSNISSTCHHNMVNFGPLYRLRSVRLFGAPLQISTGFASWLRYCSDIAQRRPSKLCTMFGRLLG